MLTLTNRIDMRPGAVPLIIHLGQYDSDFSLVFELYSSAGNFTVESGTTAMIRGTKTDGNAYDADATIDVSAKTVTVAGSEQMTAAKGRNVYELVLKKGTKVLSTANFILDVERAAMDADTIASESVLKELNAIIAGAATATEAAADAASAADRAEDAAESVSSASAQIATNTADISDLKADLSDTVDLDGEHQVTPQNIQGMQFTKTTGEVEGENIFNSEMLFGEGQYVSVATDGTVGIGLNANYNAYCIPVEQNTKYKFTTSRFVVLATGNTVNSPAIGTTQSNLSEIETGSASYLFLSIDVNSISNIYVKPVNVDYVYSDFILPDWLIDNLPIPTVVEKPKFAIVTGNLASGWNLQLTAPKNNLRKGERVVFEGNISSFDSLRIGLSFSTAVGTDGNQMNTFRIDGTNISYYARSNSTPVTVAHGLTLANNIQIIWEMSAEASVKLTLISNGNMFSHEFANFTRQTIGNPFVLSVGTVLTDCKLTWTCSDIDKDIWMFGDSYFAYDPARWTYYLHKYGYDQNCLLDGFSGEGGTNGRVAFNNLLKYGTPKFAVWCLGMNDGADSDSAPSADWVSARDYFLLYCEQNNVTPVFATIPTVPTISHEQKNAWIRSSGYRYIDFAKAVGASTSGVWYGDTLSSDGVHPSESGAKALFAQVLIDLPEIMLDDWR